ncbi:N-formylglutamate amidohydrolase [Stakelama marina]|uniref:N-formylglutamate amidohydrolase n=1 Tax=Stakelama marina TaxID=2826939 RepID=A0A8T4IC29_9SPHN|nr:N-formylglutamate amidohydrolase [Stakelama marina]MBR0551652.1 N-formylglutamate amidohydrolase [Stakelama marina]
MSTVPTFIPGSDSGVLLLCDHASNHVPDDIDLGVTRDIVNKHIGVDIGAGPLTLALAERLNAPAILATVSRLVVDLHREPDHAGLIPVASDGHEIPGNRSADRDARIARFFAPYHGAIARRVAEVRPELIVAIHSFTPELERGGEERPWEVGILYNRDDRAASLALSALRERKVNTGDNEPYSGRKLNATLNRHGEANGIPCISIEVRNDLISDAPGVRLRAELLEDVLKEVRNGLASKGASAT